MRVVMRYDSVYDFAMPVSYNEEAAADIAQEGMEGRDTGSFDFLVDITMAESVPSPKAIWAHGYAYGFADGKESVFGYTINPYEEESNGTDTSLERKA